jgi:hypothetical protein
MFDLDGDDILLDGHKVGRLEGAWPTLRERAIFLLRNGIGEEERDDIRNAAYDEGMKHAGKHKRRRS